MKGDEGGHLFYSFHKIDSKNIKANSLQPLTNLLSDFLLCRKMTKNARKRRSLKMIRDKTKYHNENEEDAMCHM